MLFFLIFSCFKSTDVRVSDVIAQLAKVDRINDELKTKIHGLINQDIPDFNDELKRELLFALSTQPNPPVDVVKELAKREGAFDVVDENGNNAFVNIIINQHNQLVKELASIFSDLSFQNKDGNTIFHLAFAYDKLALLLDNIGKDDLSEYLNIKNGLGLTVIQNVAKKLINSKTNRTRLRYTFRELVNKGADADIPFEVNESETTPNNIYQKIVSEEGSAT